MTESSSDSVGFPITMAWQNGEVDTFESVRDLAQNLEDFDSDDPASRAELRSLTDRVGRPLRLKVRLQDVVVLELEQRP